MRTYRFGDQTSWITEVIHFKTPWIAFYYRSGLICHVYEDQELIAVIDCKQWCLEHQEDTLETPVELNRYLQTELDKQMLNNDNQS
jgi:hypothetical protein